MNKNFDKNWERTKQVIDDHIKKADIVSLDTRNLNSAATKKVTDYIKALPPEAREKILFLEQGEK